MPLPFLKNFPQAQSNLLQTSDHALNMLGSFTDKMSPSQIWVDVKEEKLVWQFITGCEIEIMG